MQSKIYIIFFVDEDVSSDEELLATLLADSDKLQEDMGLENQKLETLHEDHTKLCRHLENLEQELESIEEELIKLTRQSKVSTYFKGFMNHILGERVGVFYAI